MDDGKDNAYTSLGNVFSLGRCTCTSGMGYGGEVWGGTKAYPPCVRYWDFMKYGLGEGSN